MGQNRKQCDRLLGAVAPIIVLFFQLDRSHLYLALTLRIRGYVPPLIGQSLAVGLPCRMGAEVSRLPIRIESIK